jgi:predicted transposase/invertase (TIGR01784 family)
MQDPFEQAEIAHYSESERRQYFESQKEYWDNYSIMTTALNKGRAEGRAEEKLENARNLKANGVSIELIAKSLGLAEEEVEKL